MKRILLFFTTAILLLAACRQQNANQLKAINECLQTSNAVIEEDNKLYYQTIAEKLKDPLTHRDAEIWEPGATVVKRHVDSITLLIEDLRSKLLKQSDSLRKANAPIVEQLYETNGDGYVLLNKLTAFKESIPGIFKSNDFSDKSYLVTDLKQAFGFIPGTIPLLPGYTDSLSETQRGVYKKKWVEESFAGSNSLLTMMRLNKIKSEVLVTERALVSYFISKIPIALCGFTRQPHPFAIINSSYVKSGQSIEVTAGVLQFNPASRARVTINGKEIKLDDDDRAEFSFTAKGRPGKHIIPVTIDYYKRDGTESRVRKDIQYIIAENQ